MAKKEVLKVEHVGMKFNLSQEKVDDLKDYLIKISGSTNVATENPSLDFIPEE